MNRKKAALAVIGAFLFIIGCLVAFIFYTYHQGRDHLGSPTIEYVTTERHLRRRRPRRSCGPSSATTRAQRTSGPTVKLRPPFRRVWRAGGATLFEFPPAIAYGRLYLADGAGRVLAVSTKTGARAWSVRLAPLPGCVAGRRRPAARHRLRGLPQPPAVQSEGAADGEVVALSAGRGKVRWTTHIGASETSPVVVGNRLYVGDWLGHVYALDKRTGRTIWTATTGGAVKGGIAVSGNQVYAGSYDGHLYAFDARNGHLLWRASGDPRLFGHGQFYSTPAAAYGRVYIGSTDGKVYSFGATSGRRLLVAQHRRLRLRLARGVAAARARRLVQPHVLRVRRGDR